MHRSEHSKNLVGERLPDLLDAGEVEFHAREPLEPMGHAFRLRSRHQFFALMLREAQRHHRLVEGACR